MFNSIFDDMFKDLVCTSLFPKDIFTGYHEPFAYNTKDNSDYHYHSKEWKDGKVVSEDEVEYKDGKKVTETHKKFSNGKCICDDCKCKKAVGDNISKKEDTPKEISKEDKTSKFSYYEKQIEEYKQKVADLKEQNRLLKEKIDKIKNMF